jgi:hypothetical protein
LSEGFAVEAPGIEVDTGQPETTMEHQSGTIGTDPDPVNVSDRAPKCAIFRGVVTESSEAYELSNVVETALAKALVLAAEAKRWEVVAQIVEELRRRGSAQTGLTPERLKRSSKVWRGGAPAAAPLISR